MSWLSWPLRLATFGAWFAKELLVSSVAVLRDNLTPGQDSAPGIVRMPTRCRTDGEVTLLAALITLTPGTLTLGTEGTGEQRTLFVHGMYSGGPDELRRELRTMETHMLHAVRRRGGPA